MAPQNHSRRLRDYQEFAEVMPEHFPVESTGAQIIREPGEVRDAERNVGERYLRKGLDPAWSEVGLHYEDPYCRLVRDAVRFPGGGEVVHHRVLWKSGPVSGVVMLPRFNGRFVLIRHFRHPILRYSWECPRGSTANGETLEETIRKELMEEIGATLTDYKRLGHMTPISSFLDSGVDLFLVELGGLGEPETGEGIEEILLLSASELKSMVVEGAITDASTISAVAQASFQGLLD